MGRRCAAFVLRRLRNLLIVAGLAFIALGAVSMIQAWQEVEREMAERPVAYDDPSAQPFFDDITTSEMHYSDGDCLACHRDILHDGTAEAASPNSAGSRSGNAVPGIEVPWHRNAETGWEASSAAIATPMSPQPLATPTAVLPRHSAEPRVPTRIAIPSIAVDSPITAVGTTTKDGQAVWEVPKDVVGWFRATAMAGALGNMVMSGHVAQVEGLGVFRDLYQVHIGDTIYVDAGAKRLTYKVSDVGIVLPSETSYLRPTPDASLTLITCTGTYDAATRTFSRRLIVIAKLTDVGQ